jgi:hypothetical protein
MLTIDPFAWRRLTPKGAVEYRLREDGFLALRGEAAPPFVVAPKVRRADGGFGPASLEALGFVWVAADDGDGWLLRTHGAPSTMDRTLAHWAPLVRELADPLGLDERLALVTIACESGGPAPDGDGLVKAPRTEKGYPRRAGERDPGDLARDAEDWAASRGMHSSHGLLQTLIGTAYGARPDLFQGVAPADFRKVLWRPANSLACALAYAQSFPAAHLADPLAFRVHYGSGRIAPADNLWGAVVYDDRVPLDFLARWNDGACIAAGTCASPAPAPPPEPAPRASTAAWLVTAFSLFALSTFAALGAAAYSRRSQAARPMEVKG